MILVQIPNLFNEALDHAMQPSLLKAPDIIQTVVHGPVENVWRGLVHKDLWIDTLDEHISK